METITQKRDKIIKRIRDIPEDKLKELEVFLSKIEKKTGIRTKVLSFAGVWKEINDDLFDDLTTNLISHRQPNRNRDYE